VTYQGARARAADDESERFFMVVNHDDGRETIGFDGEASPGRGFGDIETLDDAANSPAAAPAGDAPAGTARAGRRKTKTLAASKVELDADGRVVAVLWGRVDTAKNAWASTEVVVPVAEVVRALRTGDPVFALFPSTHGHVPERRFVAADYDDGRQTIVLECPATHEREIHDMDRLGAVAG
jgi:hypothetical protein